MDPFTTFRKQPIGYKAFSIAKIQSQLPSQSLKQSTINKHLQNSINDNKFTHSRVLETPLNSAKLEDVKKPSITQNDVQVRQQTYQSINNAIINRYPTLVSLQKSSISLPPPNLPEDQIHLQTLQSSLFMQIITLKQRKIQLIQQYNNIIDDKNQLEREINKIIKAKNRKLQLLVEDHIILDSKFNQNMLSENKWAHINTFQPILDKYLQLQSIFNQKCYEEENFDELMKEEFNLKHYDSIKQYEKYNQLCQSLEQTLSYLNNNNQNTQQLYNQATQKLKSKVQILENRNSQLQSRFDHQNNTQILQLKQQNKKLIRQADELLKKRKRKGQVTSIEGLRKIIEINDNMKEASVKDIIKYKQQIDKLKGQNAHLRLASKQQV